MKTSASNVVTHPRFAERPRIAGDWLRDQQSVFQRLERLESAHELLLRYARDLRRAYEAEREHRARLTRATLQLASVLTGVLEAGRSARKSS